jgi:porin
VTNRHGKSLSDIALGNNTSVQEVWGTQNTHLAILTWEQKLFQDRLIIEAGRSQANIHFLNSPLYCLFQTNSTCGNPTFVFKNSNFTYFPASSWMAQAKLWVAPRWFAHAGVYEVNPDRKRWNDDGFNFSSANRTGVIVPWELGYADDKGETRLPGHYILGGWFDRADYSDPLRDDQGGIAILTGRPARTLHGRSGIYVRFDQQLTRPDPATARAVDLRRGDDQSFGPGGGKPLPRFRHRPDRHVQGPRYRHPGLRHQRPALFRSGDAADARRALPLAAKTMSTATK